MTFWKNWAVRLAPPLMGLLLAACAGNAQPPKVRIDASAARAAYGAELTVTPLDGAVTVEPGVVTIAPAEEGATYTLSGYLSGQVVCTTRNTVIRLDGAYLENPSGAAALRCTAKAEVSAARGSVNYIVSRRRSYAKSAALQGRRGLVLGGSGTLYVCGYVCHAVEADDVRMKGSGAFYLQGTRRGSALTCETFAAADGKSFSCYCVNSKNGIKADQTISIASGSFYLYNNTTALKTDSARESPRKPHAITLSGGTFHTYGNGSLFRTEACAADGATFIQEDL